MEQQIALELKNISKRFGSIQANKNINLAVYKGEILALLGENGSGKTTLMNMISGIYFPDEGEIFVNGKEAVIRSPQDAFDLKIGMIHQHFKLVDVFTATENIVLGVKDAGKYDLKKEDERVREISDKYGFRIDPKKKIYDMSVSEKQTVEIIKVLYRGADILILDEPTAVLTPQEISKLFVVLRKMKEDGKSILIITHKLNEVMAISDHVAVLRKGEYIGMVETKKTTESALTEMMVGKKITLNIERSLPKNTQDRLVISNLCYKNQEGVAMLSDVSFTVRSGEILGIAGIAGSGQKELLESIAGLRKLENGDMIFHSPKKDCPVTFFHKKLDKVKQLALEDKFYYAEDIPADFLTEKQLKILLEKGTVKEKDGKYIFPVKQTVSFVSLTDKQIKELVNSGKIFFKEDEIVDLKGKTPLEIRELGIRLSFVPEDRLGMGLVGNMDIVDNMMLRSYRKGKGVFVDRKKPGTLADEVVHDLEVVTPSLHTPVRRLSGGNVQKVLVGREISAAPKVFMAAYPVRGLDINSSYMIYNLLNRQKESGTAVIFVGEDLDVLLGLCDRILVIAGGKVTGIVDGRTAKKEEIGLLMTKTDDVEVEDGKVE